MPNRSEAEEHLRIIRSLMERATIYRAISAPVALVGGLASSLFGMWFVGRYWSALLRGEDEGVGVVFITGWLGVLSVTGLANAWFIWRAAKQRGEPFISPAMHKALWALFPPVLAGGVFTAVVMTVADVAVFTLPIVWMIFYGLGLLATAQFAPKSIGVLGWCFLATGLLYVAYLAASSVNRLNGDVLGCAMMLSTFGLFHLIYAACTWPRKSAAAADSDGEG